MNASRAALTWESAEPARSGTGGLGGGYNNSKGGGGGSKGGGGKGHDKWKEPKKTQADFDRERAEM